MPDIAHRQTDEIIATLEKRIGKEYGQAVKEVQGKLDDYLRRFELKDKRWREWVANGKRTEEEYRKWRKGQIMIPKEVETGDKKNPVKPNGAAADVDEFEMMVLEVEADDYEDADDEWIVYTEATDLMAVKRAIEAEGIETKGAELTMIAQNPATVSVADAKKVMRLIDRLEELEDLQNVYHTMDITDEIAAALEEE